MRKPDQHQLTLERWVRPKRNAGEDVFSYAVRLTEANGFLSVTSFLRDAGLTFGNLASGTAVSVIAAMTRCDPDALAADSFVTMTDGVVIKEAKLALARFSAQRTRAFCPTCFRKDRDRPALELLLPRPWARAYWNILGITSCPEHCERLQDTCACGKHFGVRDPKIAECECGEKLWDLAPIVVNSTAASAYVIGRLGFGPSITVPLLDGLALEDAMRAMEIFGREELDDGSDRHLGLCPGSAAEPVEGPPPGVMETGFRIIEAPDRIVRETIAKIATRRPERHGAAIAFGDAWAFARDLRPSRSRDRLQALMRDHALRTRGLRKGASAAEALRYAARPEYRAAG